MRAEVERLMRKEFGQVFYDRFEAVLDNAHAAAATPTEVIDELHKVFIVKYLRSLLN